MSVSYTHLDVYKRQALVSGYFSFSGAVLRLGRIDILLPRGILFPDCLEMCIRDRDVSGHIP